MNVKPKNYEWVEFYDRIIDITEYTFSSRAIYKRVMANSGFTTKTLNVVRAISSEGYGRIKFFKKIRQSLITDKIFRDYFEGESETLPQFYLDIIEKELGYMYKWLPKGAVYHDHHAYLNKQMPISEKVSA